MWKQNIKMFLNIMWSLNTLKVTSSTHLYRLLQSRKLSSSIILLVGYSLIRDDTALVSPFAIVLHLYKCATAPQRILCIPWFYFVHLFTPGIFMFYRYPCRYLHLGSTASFTSASFVHFRWNVDGFQPIFRRCCIGILCPSYISSF